MRGDRRGVLTLSRDLAPLAPCARGLSDYAGGAETASDVDAERAARRAVPGAHTIWELMLHINAWQKAAVELIDGGPGRLADPEDWPRVSDESPAAWTAALAALESGHAGLKDRILLLDDEDLDRRVEARPYSVYVLLHGILQHGLYHAGQIGLLKRATA